MVYKATARHGDVAVECEGQEPFTMTRAEACRWAIDLLYAVTCAADYHDPDVPHDALAALDKWHKTIKENSL